MFVPGEEISASQQYNGFESTLIKITTREKKKGKYRNISENTEGKRKGNHCSKTPGKLGIQRFFFLMQHKWNSFCRCQH